jgi:hypothetical protein
MIRATGDDLAAEDHRLRAATIGPGMRRQRDGQIAHRMPVIRNRAQHRRARLRAPEARHRHARDAA